MSDSINKLYIIRGGSWSNGQALVSAADRLVSHPGSRDVSIGFRILSEKAPKETPKIFHSPENYTVRGGCWIDLPLHTHSTYRGYEHLSGCGSYLGFRVLQGKESNKPHMIRGGSWINSPENVRSDLRGNNPPDNRYYFVGFRVLSPNPPRSSS